MLCCCAAVPQCEHNAHDPALLLISCCTQSNLAPNPSAGAGRRPTTSTGTCRAATHSPTARPSATTPRTAKESTSAPLAAVASTSALATPATATLVSSSTCKAPRRALRAPVVRTWRQPARALSVWARRAPRARGGRPVVPWLSRACRALRGSIPRPAARVAQRARLACGARSELLTAAARAPQGNTTTGARAVLRARPAWGARLGPCTAASRALQGSMTAAAQASTRSRPPWGSVPFPSQA